MGYFGDEGVTEEGVGDYYEKARGVCEGMSKEINIENLTAISWPKFITDLAYNPATHRIVMGYDRLRNGLKISKTTIADGTNSCWWYDFTSGGLFPETYPEECLCSYPIYFSGKQLLSLNDN